MRGFSVRGEESPQPVAGVRRTLPRPGALGRAEPSRHAFTCRSRLGPEVSFAIFSSRLAVLAIRSSETP